MSPNAIMLHRTYNAFVKVGCDFFHVSNGPYGNHGASAESAAAPGVGPDFAEGLGWDRHVPTPEKPQTAGPGLS